MMTRVLLAALTMSIALWPSAQAQESARQEPADVGNESAAAFLEESEKLIYHPDQYGLDRLAFKVNREYAPGKALWTVSVEWKKGADAKVDGSVSNAAPIPAAMKTQVQASLSVVGEVFVSEQLGRFLSYLQGVATPTRDGTEEGFVRISLAPRPGGKTNFAEKTLLFDEKRILRKARTRLQDTSILMETYKWRTVEEHSSQLILESVTANLTMQGIAITRVTTYNYKKLAGHFLIASLTIKTSGISNNPVRNEDLQFNSFVVNGKPVEAR